MKEFKKIIYPCFKGTDGNFLSVYEETRVPFQICRVFTVSANNDASRGKHAHKKCNQLLALVQGRIKLTCDDGERRSQILLEKSGEAAWVKNGIWAEEDYCEDNSVLLVLCDLPYDENDYIWDYEEYKIWKRTQALK